MKYAFITHQFLSANEISVQCHDAGGNLMSGFRSSDVLGWREKTRNYTSGEFCPVFQANKPAELLA